MRVIAAYAALLLCLAGCDEPAAPSTAPATASAKITIGYSAPEWGGAQYEIMDGVRQRAQQRGWKVLLVNANFDSGRQKRQIDFLIRSGVKAIVAVPLDSDMIAQSAHAAREAGVLFYTIDRAPSTGKVNMVVQADNRMAGQQAGEGVVDFLRRRYGSVRGTVLQLRGDLSQTVSLEREEGFVDVLAKHPEVKLINRDTSWQARLFAEHTEEVLKTTKVDAIYLQSDMIGVPEVVPVMRKLGRLHPSGDPRHVFLAGVDGGPPALDAIRQGFMDLAISQPLTRFGIVVGFIEQELNGEAIALTPEEESMPKDHALHVSEGPTGPRLQMHTTPVTAQNVDDPDLWGNSVSLPAGE